MTIHRTALSVLATVAAVPVVVGTVAGVSSATESHRGATSAHAVRTQPAPATTASTTTTAETPPTTASPRAASGRPVLRVEDTTNQPTPRRVRLFEAYSSCLLHHGAEPATSGMSPDLTFSGHGTLVQQPVPAAATAACTDVEPVQPPELSATTNPDFAAQAQTYVACLSRHGEQGRLLNDHDLDWTWSDRQDPSTIPDDGGRTEDACLVASFG